jgi:hypothetical protein
LELPRLIVTPQQSDAWGEKFGVPLVGHL